MLDLSRSKKQHSGHYDVMPEGGDGMAGVGEHYENQRARLYLSSIQEGPGIARLYAERGNQPVLIISKDDGIH